MNKGYEERYLITLLSAVMNQTAVPEPMRKLNWDKMFRWADYHHVAHAVYYGIMGLEEEIPQSIHQRFFEKYLEGVYRTERLRAGEEEVSHLLERGEINCFVLRYSDIIGCYPIEEMCCCESIEVGADKKHMKSIEDLLNKVDYEERQTEEHGHVYYRVPGTRVLYYNQNLFFSRSMRKFFKSLLSNLPYRKGCKYVREMPLDDKYLFLMCRLTDRYARGEISLNLIIDFWAFYTKNAESFSWPYIYEKLKKLKIAEFAERLEFLILRWFGTGAGIENNEIYDAMENYILTKGAEGREISSKFLPLINTVADCYARNRKAEKWKKVINWTFPDKDYMETIYPFLEKHRFLLPLFWIMRLIRYMIRYIWHVIEGKLVSKVWRNLPYLKKSGTVKKIRRSKNKNKKNRDLLKKWVKKEDSEKEKAAEIPK